MEDTTKQGARHQRDWVARLMQVQLAVSSLGAKAESPVAADRWPARLIHAGTVLIGVSGAVLATWLSRHL